MHYELWYNCRNGNLIKSVERFATIEQVTVYLNGPNAIRLPSVISVEIRKVALRGEED